MSTTDANGRVRGCCLKMGLNLLLASLKTPGRHAEAVRILLRDIE